jgi:NAD(P)-dependent dehydrogenase (short-subunit alcohol dehydrogenase family)
VAVVLITGCSSGFGLLTALECARRGDRVFATMRDLSKDGDLRSRASEDGLDVDVVQLDVCDEASVARAVADVHEAAGRLDALVNNAGVGRLGPLEHFDDDEVRALFETNVYGAIRMIRAVLPIMREQREGVIVNVSSVGGLVAPPFFSLYCATKFALEAITDGVGAEVEPYGVRVISVAPGAYDTPIAAKGDFPAAGYTDESPYRDEFETVREQHLAAMKANDKPEEVAVAIADAIHDPTSSVRVVVPASLEFVATSRGQTPPDQLRKALRQNYGLD